MTPIITVQSPILVPNSQAIGCRASFICVAAVYTLAIVKLFLRDIRQRKVGHVEFGKKRLRDFAFLFIAQAETEKRYFKAVTLPGLGAQMTRVIPPLGLNSG